MSLARFGVRKPVPVNLLMIAVLVAGIVAAFTLRREFFPEADPDMALITMPYPGATPEEIEETLAIKVEDALADIDGIKEIRTTLAEGGGGMTVEFSEGADVDEVMDDIERAIDALQDLPDESEEITVQLFEPRIPVIRLSLYGDTDERVLKRAIREIQDELRLLPGMGEVLVEGVRGYEIRVDVQREAMLKQGLSLPQISDAIRGWMADLPGGTLRSSEGNIKIRTIGVPERADAIRNIVLRADPQGRVVRVGDVATVSDTFVDEQIVSRFDGDPAAGLIIFATGNQDIVHIADNVRAYVDGKQGLPYQARGMEKLMGQEQKRAWQLGSASPRPLPPGTKIAAHSDFARFVEGRLDLLLRNAAFGAVLVFGTLLLFLNWRVAFWVGMGLLVALCGTLMLMAWLDITLNLLTMFGLIIVLGLLVDDAIVVAENIQTRHDRGETALEAAVKGTEQVLWPVVATVTTTIVAFLPLTFIRGRIGDLMGALPTVVAVALLCSLLEALLILPSHMGHSLKKRDHSHPGRTISFVRRLERWRDHLLLDRMIPGYARVLAFLLRHRYESVAVALAVLIVSIGAVVGGRVPYTFLTSSDSETVIADVRMPIGTPIEKTTQIMDLIDAAARSQPEVKSTSATVGTRTDIDTGASDAFAPHIAQMFIELVRVEERDRESGDVIGSIRQALAGKLAGVDRIGFNEVSGGPGGPDISIRVRGAHLPQVEAASAEIKRMLGDFGGVVDIADDSELGQRELQIALRPAGAALGFTTADIARQVRGFLFGIDAHVFAAEREDIDVRVRLDEPSRRSLYEMENIWVISPQGRPVPLTQVADLQESTSYATIRRVDRQRAITVTADTMPGYNPELITAELPLDQLRARFPKLIIEYAGRQEQQADAFASLPLGGLAALAMIYVILAWLFSSYTQPVVVMLAIPFSIVGVVWGHALLGYDMTFLSVIGFVALSGIVVNDSLILVEFYNDERRNGRGVFDSLVEAGRARLRAILLTTLTTVLGLLPLILEQSFQAKFLIPMAITVAMGLVSATALVLLVLPCLMMIFDDVSRGGYFLWHGRPRPSDSAVEDDDLDAPAPLEPALERTGSP